MNVLAIGCHPDDVEIACAGTLSKCVKRGDKVVVAHLCNGSLGHVVIPPEELEGVTTVDIAQRIHAMMAQDLGAEYAEEA